MQPRSLSTRLLASVTVLLIVFFGITIVALDLVFQDLAEHMALPQFTLTDEPPVGRVWRLPE